jgi:hypothetical protein
MAGPSVEQSAGYSCRNHHGSEYCWHPRAHGEVPVGKLREITVALLSSAKSVSAEW